MDLNAPEVGRMADLIYSFCSGLEYFVCKCIAAYGSFENCFSESLDIC